MNKKGILIILSGFSGVGKGTVVRRLLSDYDNYALSISATTRKPREGEEDGVSYFFKSKEEFEQMIKEDSFIEHARYVENYYGTPKAYVQEQLDAGKDVILEIEIQGALKVKEKYPDALMLFLVPPDAQTLKERLVGRGTETADVIHDRLERAAQEAQEMGSYEYIIVNDDLDTCVKQVHELIQSAHCKKSHNTAFIKELQQDMNCFLKGNDFMLHPSYTDLMKVANSEVNEGETPVVNSRYSIVMATAKRARELIDGAPALVYSDGKKPLSIAVEELDKGKIKILAEDESGEDEE